MRPVLLLLAACGGPQIGEHHATDLTKVLPATLEVAHPKEGEPRPVKVRVWADAAIRALPRWKEDLTDQLDYAGQLLTPMLGIRLQVETIKDWERTGDPRDALKALAQADDGKDVTWVIGYVAPQEVASKAMSELGDAHALGNAVIVRGWADKAETSALAMKLPHLKPAERSEVLAAHKRHKQTVVLLHVLGQTLGMIGETDSSWIGNLSYSPKQNTFSERNRELMQISIDARLGSATDPQIAHDLLENIEKHDWGGWVAGDHDDVVKMLRNVVDSTKAGKTAADVPAAAYEQFDRIRELHKRGDTREALVELDNLLAAYPGNATMVELKCEIMIDGSAPPSGKPAKGAPKAEPPKLGGVSDPATRIACARVSELAPGDPSPHLALGEALAKGNDVAGARAELAKAAAKIGNLQIGQPDAWRKLIAIYQAMGALTWTEDALAAAKLDHDPAAAVVAQTRARYGVPRGAKVKPEDEAALVAAVRNALDLIYSSKYADAERALAAADKKWPGAPGLAAARCDLELRQGQAEPARAQCQRALAADPDDSWALYLSGVIALKDTSASGTKTGIERLKKAIAVDPDLGQAWRALGKAYARAKDQPAIDDLAKQYQVKFGQALPE